MANTTYRQGAKAIVIGAGLGGIAAALRLRKRGYDVTLLEKQNQLGGRAGVYYRNGYTFDAGPTVVTAPFLFDELFELFGKKREDYVKFVPLYPWYRIVFADGTHFDYGGTLKQTLEEIRKIEPADCEGYLKLLAHTKKIFDVGFTQLGDQPFHTFWSMAKCAPQLMKLGTWRTVWQMTCKYIKSDKLRRVFSFQPLLVGGNPFNTTSIYSLIQYLEREWGVHFAMGGTAAIVAGLGRLMEEEGIEVRLNTEVKHLNLRHVRKYRDGKPLESIPSRHAWFTSGVTLKTGEIIDAEPERTGYDSWIYTSVVCNADAPFVYRRMMPTEYQSARPPVRKWTDLRISNLKFSMGLFVLYFGTTRQYPDLAHHTIILGERYAELLRDMFDLKKLATNDLSLYLHRPTATDPSMAPAGCDSFYVLCPVPNLQGDTDWATMGPKYRDIVIDELAKTVMPGLRECITEDFYVTPLHFRDNLNTLHGTGFSIQPTFGQSAYFRFHNKSEDIEGLYFVGAGTHPGAGMPGVLCSAKVLEHLL